ncbi:hypothetical protein ACFL0T_08965 [Candidatus Omnitrophota bacterium]
MARKRMINPEFWNDPKIIRIEPIQRLLFIGLVSNANDYGKLRGDPRIVKSKVFPTDDSITNDIVEKGLSCLKEQNLIDWYEHDSEQYIYLKGWHKNQRLEHPAKDVYPDPPNKTNLTKDSGNPPEDISHKSSQAKSIEDKLNQSNLSQISSSKVKRSQAKSSSDDNDFLEQLCLTGLTEALDAIKGLRYDQKQILALALCDGKKARGRCRDNDSECEADVASIANKVKKAIDQGADIKNMYAYTKKAIDNYLSCS